MEYVVKTSYNGKLFRYNRASFSRWAPEEVSKCCKLFFICSKNHDDTTCVHRGAMKTRVIHCNVQELRKSVNAISI